MQPDHDDVVAESGFERLAPGHPLLLLPIRLETRFAWLDTAGGISFTEDPAKEQALLVRVYPDEIHEDTHEPELTPAESRWVAEFHRAALAAMDMKPLEEAWAELIARAGPTRAAWLGEVALSRINPGKRAGTFTRAAVARLMPDRWVGVATLPDGSMLSATSAPVRTPLELGVSPRALDWTVHFEAAMKVGMAMIVRSIPPGVDEITRLVVVGACGSIDPASTQADVEHLLQAHHFTRGTSFIEPGTPTNNTPGSRAGFSTRPSVHDVIAVESRRLRFGRTEPLCQPGDRTDATALAAALGIEPATFAFTARADSTDQLDGEHLRAVLAAVTRRRLTRLLAGSVPGEVVDELLGFLVQTVSALGPLPTIRVGAQPYGVLPVMLTDPVYRTPGSTLARYGPVLDSLRAHWTDALGSIDRVGGGGDPGVALVRILQRDGVASRLHARPALRPGAANAALAGLDPLIVRALDEQRSDVVAVLSSLGMSDATTAPLVQSLHAPFAPAITAPLVQADELPAGSVQRAALYLEIAASLRPERLAHHDYDGGERPLPLLFALARLAMLELADVRAREVLTVAGTDPARWDDEEPPSVFNDAFGTAMRRLEANDPADPVAPIGFHLSLQGRDAWVLQGMRESLRHLARRPPELLDLQLRATLGVFSHRLDAWYTALATEQLRQLRSEPATMTGLNAGAYGVVEHIVRAPRQPVAAVPGRYVDPSNGGYIHAPSVNHGAAAAVLRSVHLAHSAAGGGEAFSVDLSSNRVRRGLQIVQGVRAGQPLAALLGYIVERELASEALQRLIAPFRDVAPLLANTLTPSTLPAESVAATNVTDGLTLLELAGYNGDQSATVSALWAAKPILPVVNANESAAVSRVLSSAQDALDAVSDLVLAEGVYQSVLGNPARTGAAVDSVSGAPVPPAQVDVVRTPRSGIATTHRVLAVLDADAGGTTGWATTFRAVAESRLEAWCAGILPKPSQIRLRARFVAPDGAIVATLDDLVLSDLFDAAATVNAGHLPLAALDILAQADPRDTPQRSSLEVRLCALAELRRPANAGAADVELVFDRSEQWDPTTFGVVEVLEVAARLRDLTGYARPLTTDDLTPPGQQPALTVQAGEHAGRAQQAMRALSAAHAQLAAAVAGSAAALRLALFAADALGISGAAPGSLRDAADPDEQARRLAALRQQVDAARAETTRRMRRFTEAAGDPGAQLEAVFGPGFVSLPLITAGGGPLPMGVDAAGASGPAVRSWVARAARAREGVRLLDEALSAAEAVAQTHKRPAPPALNVRQLGAAAGEPWTALPLPAGEQLLGGRVSLVLVGSGTLPVKSVAGLFVDEWLEVVPNREETTSVAFHVEAPSSAPPQVALLGVPAPGHDRWSADLARQLVDEAIALGQLRLVDVDDIPGLGQLVPALVTEENTGGESNALDVERLTRVETP